ncbi:MAG: exodeoxyribonuclease VII large subunit [Pyrinomonadaceae bacterium]|nr:exodeoxyribonuclease VII large subunit [Pyrinomonadaceae bacterium]
MTHPLLLSLFDESERRPLSVSELTAQVRGAIENRFAAVWLEGEISNFKAHTSGHWYFTIKDESAQIRATCFRGVNSRIRFRPSDGLQIRARGRLTVYEPRGEYELAVEGLDPVGAGTFRVAFEQMRERLAAEGLFDEKVKRPIPLLPRRVGIVTSRSGAALHDILRTLARRTRTVAVLIAHTRVQGEEAGAEIARAIDSLNSHHTRAEEEGRGGDTLDVIIIGRGGGSIEDLWAFNDAEVARAIRRSAVPVISAVGHETDFTLADFAADVRAATPTAAAELVAAREADLVAHVENLNLDLFRHMRFRVMEDRARLQEATLSPGFDDVRARLRHSAQRTVEASHKLETSIARHAGRARRRASDIARRLTPAPVVKHRTRGAVRLVALRSSLDAVAAASVETARARLRVAAASLEALSPLAVLARGFAIAQDESGRALRSSDGVNVGERVRVQLARGALRCRIEEVEKL